MNRSYDKLRNMGDVGAMTYHHATLQNSDSVVAYFAQTNAVDEITRLEDVSAQIRNNIVAYTNELTALETELRTIEHQRANLTAMQRC